jgi:hypothetical protein
LKEPAFHKWYSVTDQRSGITWDGQVTIEIQRPSSDSQESNLTTYLYKFHDDGDLSYQKTLTFVSPFRGVIINNMSLYTAENVIIKEFQHQYIVNHLMV